MQSKQNMWTWPDSQLQGLLDQYKIKLESFNRKEAISAIKNYEENIAVEGMKETQSYVDQLKKEQPTLKLRKVIFHSIGEQDIPYVFVGHNGLAFYIPKEQEVEVPEYILKSCIQNAVEDRMFPRVQTNGEVEWIIRKVQRYPYSYVD